MLKYMWKCPICKATGHKWMSRYKVRRNGQVHIKNKHNRNREPTILKKML